MKILAILFVCFGLIYAQSFSGEFIYAANKSYKVYIHDFKDNNIIKNCGDENIDETIDLNSFILYVGDKRYEGKKDESGIVFSPIAKVSYNDENVTIKMLVKKIILPIIKKQNIKVLSYYDENTCFIKSEFDENQTMVYEPYSNYSSISYINYIDENVTNYQTFISNFNGVHPTFQTKNRVISNKDLSDFDIKSVYDLNSSEAINLLKSKILSKFKADAGVQNDSEAKDEFFDFNNITFNENFSISPLGITFYYPECELMPCINGGITVFFDFKELFKFKK